MPERQIVIPRVQSSGDNEASLVPLVNDCNLADLATLWLNVPIVGTTILVDHPDLNTVIAYRLGNAATTPTGATAITDHTGYFWQPVSGSRFTVLTKTANYTVLDDEAYSGARFDTTGAAGTVTFALPAALPGMKLTFRVGAVQELRVDPNGTETISLPSTGAPSAAGAYLTANAIGETVEIECLVAGTWTVMGFTGTWTAV